MLLSMAAFISPHIFGPFAILLTVMEGIRGAVDTRRLFLMLSTVGDSSSHFFARTNLTVDEVREGRRSRK